MNSPLDYGVLLVFPLRKSALQNILVCILLSSKFDGNPKLSGRFIWNLNLIPTIARHNGRVEEKCMGKMLLGSHASLVDACPRICWDSIYLLRLNVAVKIFLSRFFFTVVGRLDASRCLGKILMDSKATRCRAQSGKEIKRWE